MIPRTILFAVAFSISAFTTAHAAGAQTARVAVPIMAEPSPPQIDATFNAWDLDRNGSLSIGEFRTGYRGLRRAGEMQGRLRHQFVSIDANRNGAIDASEYGNLLLIKNAGTSAPPLADFDANRNQRLEFGEYLALIRRMSVRRTTAPVAPGHTP